MVLNKITHLRFQQIHNNLPAGSKIQTFGSQDKSVVCEIGVSSANYESVRDNLNGWSIQYVMAAPAVKGIDQVFQFKFRFVK